MVATAFTAAERRALELACLSPHAAELIDAAVENSGGGGGGGFGIGGAANTNITTVGAGTLTAASLIGGVITRSGPTASYTDTTATAAQLAAAVPEFTAGMSWTVVIKNTVAFAETLTGGTGVTLSGQTIVPPLSVGTFLVTLSSATAATMRGISMSPMTTASQLVNTADTTIGAATLSAAAMAGRTITRSGSTAAYTDTTETAANIIAAIPNAQIGSSWMLTIKNTVAFLETLTGGTGVTISGISTVPPLSAVTFLMTYTAANTITMVGIAEESLTIIAETLDNTVVTGTGTMVSGAMEGARFVSLTASGQAAITLTTRTAAQIQANVPNFQVGQTYRLRIINTNTGTLTTAGGSNVTMTSTIPSNHYADYTVTFATSTTITTSQVTVAPISALFPVAGVAAGYRVARGETALDGSNPTPVAHGLTTCIAFSATLKGTAAPGDSTSVLTANINGANVDVYAWKHTTGGAAGNPTLIASTGTETFYWVAVGT